MNISTVQIINIRTFIFLALGVISISYDIAWSEQPPTIGLNRVIEKIHLITAEKHMAIQEKAGRIHHAVYSLSDQELMRFIKKLHLERIIYSQVLPLQLHGNHAGHLKERLIQQSLLRALADSDKRLLAVRILTDYALNSSSY